MVLQAHESINKNNKSKNFYTKPVTARPSRKPPVDAEETENDQNTINAKTEPVETDNMDDMETEPVGTEPKEKNNWNICNKNDWNKETQEGPKGKMQIVW